MKLLIAIISLAVLIYLPSLNVFFSGDDFYHLRISQPESFNDFLSFFSFEKNEHSASFYRPLTTQVFFFLGYGLFNLNPLGFHFISLVVFGLLLYLVYIFTYKLTRDKNLSLLGLFFYAFSASHFSQVYYLSAFQELGMAVFYFTSLIFWLRFLDSGNKKEILFVIIFFILSLLSKETAVTLPVIAFLLSLYKKRFKILSFIPLALITMIYLYLRLFGFGGVAGESYLWEVSPKIINTLGWYAAWSLGFPEMFLDFIGPKLSVSNKLWLYYNLETKIIFLSLICFALISAFLSFAKIKSNFSSFLLGSGWFLVTLLPVLFLPWHKFPLELTLPLFGIAFVLAVVFQKANRYLFTLVMVSFIILNLTSYLLTYKTHWIVRRGEVARKVLNYFEKNHPSYTQDQIYFYNDSAFITEGWGASKHIWTALSGSDALNVYYRRNNLQVTYEDIHGPSEAENFVRLGTKEFLGY